MLTLRWGEELVQDTHKGALGTPANRHAGLWGRLKVTSEEGTVKEIQPSLSCDGILTPTTVRGRAGNVDIFKIRPLRCNLLPRGREGLKTALRLRTGCLFATWFRGNKTSAWKPGTTLSPFLGAFKEVLLLPDKHAWFWDTKDSLSHWMCEYLDSFPRKARGKRKKWFPLYFLLGRHQVCWLEGKIEKFLFIDVGFWGEFQPALQVSIQSPQ